MKLKAVISKLEDVEEAYRALYTESNGEYVFSAVDVTTHPETQALRTALERSKAKSKDLQAYQKLGSVTELAERLERLDEGGDSDGAPKPKSTDLERQVKSLTKQLALATERGQKLEAGLTASRGSLDVDTAIRSVGGNPRFLRDLIMRQAKVLEEDGEWVTVIVDHKGEPRLNAKGERVTPQDLVKQLKADPEYEDAFPGTGIGGSGAPPRSGTAPDKTIAAGDERAFLANLTDIAAGKVAVATQ